MRTISAALIAAFSLTMTLFVAPARSGPLDDCEAANEKSIAGCTKVINSGQYKGHDLAVVYSNRADSYLDKEQYDLAARDADRAIQLSPKFADPHRQRGVVHHHKKEYDKAIVRFTDAIRLNPKLMQAYLDRADSYEEKNDLELAMRDLNEAQRLKPDDANVYFRRAVVHSRKDEWALAVRQMDEAIRLDGANAQFYRGRSLMKEGAKDLPGAYRDILEALSRAPDSKDMQERREELRKEIATASPPPPPSAQGAAPAQAAPAADLRPRVALVIGNGKYTAVSELTNPVNDGRDISVALRDLGFKVIEGYDLDSSTMRAKIGEFGSAMRGAGTTLFFYAGHGMQVAGKNYLIPVDAKLERPSALGVEAIEIDTILADMETEKRTNLVFIDACRDNPLSRSLAKSFGGTRSATVGQGLAQVNAGIGTLITFATSPNTVALDGTGRNSPFTAALLKHIHAPNVEIRTLLTRVRADVVTMTNEKQIPWDHSSLLGEFYFRRGG